MQPPKRVEIAVAVVEHQGRFLIGQRPKEATLGGYWEFPGGKVEPGESPAAAAVRECREETGVEIEIIGSHLVVEHDYPHAQLRIHFLAGQVVRVPGMPGDRFRWVGADELRDYSFPPANRQILQLLKRA